jgi:hypothetical protein
MKTCDRDFHVENATLGNRIHIINVHFSRKLLKTLENLLNPCFRIHSFGLERKLSFNFSLSFLPAKKSGFKRRKIEKRQEISRFLSHKRENPSFNKSKS